MPLTVSIEQIANAIYVAEGSSHTKHPYGIIHKEGYQGNNRAICIRTINHNYSNWLRLSSIVDRHGNNPSKIDFIDYLANHYCPVSCDPVGNARWKHNVKWLLEHRR